MLSIDAGASASLTNLAIVDGSGVSGGGIYNAGLLTIVDSTLSGNLAVGGNGGGGSELLYRIQGFHFVFLSLRLDCRVECRLRTHLRRGNAVATNSTEAAVNCGWNG